MPRLRVVVAVIGLVLLAFMPLRAQDREQAFKDGIDARKNSLDARNKGKEQWAEVVSHMQRAIQANPTESTNKIGSRLIVLGGTEYLPHFFLGEAQFYLGKCVEAMDAWNVSERQGVVQKVREYFAIMQASYSECETKGFLRSGKFEAAIANANGAIGAAREIADEVARLVAQAGDLGTNETSRLEQARADLQTATAKLGDGSKTRFAQDFTDAEAAAGRARGTFAGLKPVLEAVISNRAKARDDLSEVEGMIAGAAGLDGEIESKRVILTDSLANTRQLARQALMRARGKVTEALGTHDAGAIADARREVQAASDQFQEVLNGISRLAAAEAERRLGQLLRAARERFTLVGRTFVEFDRRAANRPEKDPKLTSERQVLERRFRAAQRQLDEVSADSGKIEAAWKSAEQIGVQLDRLVLTFGPRTIIDRGVHPSLARGTELFFENDFEQALNALNPQDGFPPNMPFLEHAYLFRAAALHGLSLRSDGENSAQLRERALAEVAQVKSLNAALQPDQRAFSPKFLEFFRQAGDSALAGPARSGAAGASP
jgi:hypothetical protein